MMEITATTEEIQALRGQYKAPEQLDKVAPSIREYIEKLERGLIEMTKIRNELYEALNDCADEQIN